MTDVASEWRLPLHLAWVQFEDKMYEGGFDVSHGESYQRTTESEYKVTLPKAQHSEKALQSALDEKDREGSQDDLTFWTDDEVSPASDPLNQYIKSDAVVYWTEEATFRRVSEKDLEVFLHGDDTFILVKKNQDEATTIF